MTSAGKASDVGSGIYGAEYGSACALTEAAADAIEDGYKIELVEVSDYVLSNTILQAGDVDANFSQHVPYMESFNAGNDGTLVGVQPVYDEAIL